MKKLFVSILFVLIFALVGCGKSFDQESYAASIMNFEYQMSPDLLFDEFVFVSKGDVLLEDLLISYSDLSLYLYEGDLLLEDIKTFGGDSEIEKSAKKYYLVLQNTYQEDLNDYVMLAAGLLRRQEDLNKDEKILSLEKTIEWKIFSAWKEFSATYESYLKKLGE